MEYTMNTVENCWYDQLIFITYTQAYKLFVNGIEIESYLQ